MIERNHFSCVSCGNDDLDYSHAYIYKSEIFKEYFPSLAIHKCNSCQLLQVNHSLLNNNFLTDYYIFHYRNTAEIAVAVDKKNTAFLQARGIAIAKLAKKYTNTISVRRIFELGAGFGYNLKALGELFPDAVLMTDEIDSELGSNFSKANLSDGEFDIIVLSHVLEHLLDPGQYLSAIHQSLSEDGVVIIDLPNEDSDFIYQQSPDGGYHEPHITFFSMSTFQDFLTNIGSDLFEIKEIGTAGLRKKASNEVSLVQKIYFRLTDIPLLQKVMKKIYHLIIGKSASQEYDFSNLTPEDDKIFIRTAMKKVK